jgi:hypothetical protein
MMFFLGCYAKKNIYMFCRAACGLAFRTMQLSLLVYETGTWVGLLRKLAATSKRLVGKACPKKTA